MRLKTNEFFAISKFTILKKTNATKFYVTKHDELCETSNKSNENLCFDDEIDELQNHVRHRYCQRLRNRANKRQDDFLV